jgi:hypothetical protein
MKYWVKLKTEDIIRQHITVEADDLVSALVAACNALDLSKPVVCEKHHAEMERFSRTVFYPDDFVDSVNFDTLEIEIITRRKKT